MQNTKIKWTDHTLNFWWGCTKVSRACKNCYAEQVAKVFGKRLFGQVPQWGAGKPRFERLAAARAEALKIQRQAVKSGTRSRVFVNSMSDWLDAEVPLEWLAFLLETLIQCPNVDFQLLTKRPENWRALTLACNTYFDELDTHNGDELRDALAKWLQGTPPPNVWLGTTVENQQAADTRIPHLLNIPAKVRFLSCEPLVGHVSLSPTLPIPMSGLHWVIAGGESGGKAEPSHPDWFRSLRDQCSAAKVPFFFKQWGEWLPQEHLEAAHAAAFGTGPQSKLQRSYKGQKLDDGTLMLRVGTEIAGDLLDGEQHHAFPSL